MWRKSASEQYIREAFSYLTELDLDDFVFIPQLGVELKAWGNEVHIKVRRRKPVLSSSDDGQHWLTDEDYSYQCVIKEGIGRCVYVDEWRAETRNVTLEFNSVHSTHWWNVYRTGCFIKSTRFIDHLKTLYGEGPQNAVQKPKAAGVHVRHAPEEEKLRKRGAKGTDSGKEGADVQ